jgi:hypothetical protein
MNELGKALVWLGPAAKKGASRIAIQNGIHADLQAR